MTDKKKRKATLSIQYIVAKKEEVDEMRASFDAFLKRCDIYDKGDAETPIPVMLSQNLATRTLTVNLDPCCELAFYEFDSVVAVVHNVNEIKFVFKGGTTVKVSVMMMGPDTI